MKEQRPVHAEEDRSGTHGEDGGLDERPAQNMAKMADAVKTFYATLTAEQKATFDKMQMNHMGRMQ